jgi:hypothetical protein
LGPGGARAAIVTVRVDPQAPDPAIVTSLRRAVPWLAGMIAAIAAIALLGWILSVDELKSLVPGNVTMKANTTALCLLLAGASLASLTQPRRSLARRAGTAAALLAAAAALATIFEYASP